MMGIRQMLDAFAIEPRGVVYAGAHEGEHVPEFLLCGFEHLLLVEPNPERFKALVKRQSERIRSVCAALNDRDGPVSYWAAPESLDVLNSIFEPELEHFASLAQRGRHELCFEERSVEGVTLERLLSSDSAVYNLLYMNIQGAELAALKGARSLLSRFDAIACEVDFVPRYRTGVLYDDLKSFLLEHEFGAQGLWRSEDLENDYGMACFIRSNSK